MDGCDSQSRSICNDGIDLGYIAGVCICAFL